MINILYDIPWVDGKFVTQYMVLFITCTTVFSLQKNVIIFLSLSYKNQRH